MGYLTTFSASNLLSRFRGVTIEGVWIGELNLLTSSTRHSELQVITALSLISTIYKSFAYATSSVLTIRFLVTASNSGDSSASGVQVILSQPPVQNSTAPGPSQL
jgi:hypothetical protein